MISLLERLTRRIFPATKRGERAAGTLLAVFIILIFTGGSFAAVWFCYHIALPLGLALEVFWCWQLLACRSLQVESMRVFHDLRREEIEDARESLGRIVGRDTDFLDEPSIIRAAVETVAENASDGVVAPMFYMMIGGAAGGFLYKSINTMDSMIGYRNQRYQWFGTTAARLDDLANLIPSRLTALLMIAAAGKPDFDRLQAWKIFLRDRRKHPSPNSAQGESAMAGALGIMLGGDASYFGTLHRKDTLGDPTREPEAGDIALANKLMQRASAAALVLFSAIRILVIIFLLHH
ncbi:MAG: cobalamin biosynthesis protein CobD [Eubacterium sp.]|nr:cobalamin biosynthesis protein CobD [Eubacterium sp.]